MKLWKICKRELKRNLTVMLIPHNTVRPVRITFSFTTLLTILALWTGVTVWAGYLSSRHIDYWKVKADHKIMKLKVVFFAEQVRKSQAMLDQVRENDEQMRSLLQMKSKQAIVEGDGKGGPTVTEKNDLTRVLQERVDEMSEGDIQRQTQALEEETKRRLASYQEVMRQIETERALFHATPNIWPCMGRITSSFGLRFHPVYQSNEFHSGLDIANEKNTPICATAEGAVRICDWQPGYGKLVVIDHGYGYRTYYGHLSAIKVTANQRVRRGEVIGLMGSTGTSTGNHVHYEIQYKGSALNPLRFLKKYAAPLAKAGFAAN